MLEITAAPTSRRRAAEDAQAGGGRFALLSNAKLAGLVGLVGVVLALLGVIIAYLSWQGDERDRAAHVRLPASSVFAGSMVTEKPSPKPMPL